MPSLSQSTLVHQWKTDHSVAHSMHETESICQYTISLRMDKMIFSRRKIIVSTLVLTIALVISVSAQEICTHTVHEGKTKILCGRSIAIENNKDEGDGRMRGAQPQEMKPSPQINPQQYHREAIEPRPMFQPIMTIHGKPLMRQMETFDHNNAIQPPEKFEHRSLMPEKPEHTNFIQQNENFEHKKLIQPTEKLEYRGVMQPPPPPMYEIPKVIHANENFQHRTLMEPIREQFEQKLTHNQPNENYQPTMLMQPSEKFESKLMQPNDNYQHTMLMQPSEKYETRKLQPPNENFQQRTLMEPNENFHHREPMEKGSSRKNSQSKHYVRQRQNFQPQQMSQATENIEQRQITLPWLPSQRIPSVPAPEPVPQNNQNNQIASSSSNNALNTIESSSSSSKSKPPQKFSDTRDMQTQESKKSKKWSFFKRLNNKWASGFRRKTKAILGAPRYIAAVYHKKVGEFLGVGWGWAPKKVVKHVKHVGWSPPKDKGPIIWVSGKGHDSHHGWSTHKPKYEKTVQYHEHPTYHYDHHDHHDHYHNDVQSNQLHGWSSESQYDRKSETHYISEPEATVPRSKSPILALTVKMQLPESSDLSEHNIVMKKSDDRDEGKKRKPTHMKKLTLAPLEHYRKKVKTSIKPVYL